MWKSVCIAAVALAGVCHAVNPTGSVTPANSIMCLNWASTPKGIATNPGLVSPQDIAIDGAGNIFIVDSKTRELLRIDALTGETTVMLGRNVLQIPVGLTISPTHADLYIGDENTSTIWHLPCQTRNVNYCTVYHTTPLNITLADKVHPLGLQMDGDDHLYIADHNGHRVFKRDSTTLAMTVLMSAQNIGDTTNPFGPHDIAIDVSTHELLVTDSNNDDIWTLKCASSGLDSSGNSCDQYNPTPYKLALSGSASDIAMPSGIVTDLRSSIYVTGTKNGVVAEIKGNSSVDLLQASTLLPIQTPVSIAFDARPTAKNLYISDDTNGSSTHLYELTCSQLACVPLDDRYIKHVLDGSCANTPVGSTCAVACAHGYTRNATTIGCTSSGWGTTGIACLNSSSPSSNSPAPAPGALPSDGPDAGVAVGVTVAVLIVAGVAVFLFIRHRQGKLVVKTSDYTPFGSTV